MCSTLLAATEATDTGDEDAVLMEKIHDKVAAEKAKMSISDKEELFKVKIALLGGEILFHCSNLGLYFIKIFIISQYVEKW